MKQEEWLKPGMGMYYKTGGKAGVIKTVLKNGNFTLEGDRSQWRPWDDSASPAGETWSRARILPYHGENIPKIQLLSARVRVARYSEELSDKLSRNTIAGLNMGQANRIYKALQTAMAEIEQELNEEASDNP